MKSVTLVKGETRTLLYRIEEDGEPKDITGMTFKLAVKKKASDETASIEVAGVIVDGPGGEFSFTLESTDTATALSGLMEIAMYDAGLNKLVLSTPGGVKFCILEAIA